LRKFPYPFVAALTLANDNDDIKTKDQFLALARFLNTGSDTPMGEGVGLEIGYGFWFFDPCDLSEFTVFAGAGGDLTENAGVIEDFIRAGLIDCIHGYGHFGNGGFRREHAVRALDYLSERELKLEVWVNHGGASNTHQIGAMSHQRGDDPGAEEYHTDLLLDHGVRFAEKYDLVHTVGQDTSPNLTDRGKQAFECLKYGILNNRWMAASIFSNRLIEPYRLDDGQSLYSFKRFANRWGGLKRACTRELAKQISRPVLDELAAKRGYMLVYTHLWRDFDYPQLMAPEAARAIRHLAEQYREGRIYVTTTRKLLTYNLVHRFLEWNAKRAGDETHINISGVRDDVQGAWTPGLAELQGLTFYTDTPDRTRVFLKRREVGEIVKNPPDETGRPSVSIPRTYQTFPSKYRT